MFIENIIVVIFAFFFIFIGAVIVKRNIHIWLWDYLFGEWRSGGKSKRPLHIMFCYVDHFEPHHGKVNDNKAKERMDFWLEHYPELAKRYKDADGNYLKHTWFYPYDELLESELEQLNQLCREGYGEVEFHLHHKDDTSETLRKKLVSGLEVFNKYGICITDDEKITYGFIHGNWALDNSIIRNGENFCGVNDEISILKETGCYADFTFPAYLEKSQPELVNNIFYVKDDPQNPKSHRSGIPSEVDKNYDQYDLLIVQGPMGINWRRRKLGIVPKIEDGNIHKGNLFDPAKVDLWIRTGIKVKGMDNWIFVKIFTHGAPEGNHEAVLGDNAKKLFDYLLKTYNDGEKYKLHFVTAREMYNIIKAAENGHNDDPNNYRDYKISRYKNTH